MRVLLLVALLACSVSADMYMHNPPGSNDRNRERSDNRNNGDRLFDSQNNGQGGYPWRGDRTASSADPITYYVGSKLRIEWTNQHACGANPNVLCQVIIQYACSPKDYQIPADQNAFRTQMFSMRDGYPQSGNFATDDAGTNAQGQALTYRRRQFANTNNADGTNRIPLPGENGGPTAGDEAAIDQFYYLGVTSTNPADPKIGLEYGMHESYDFYRMCQTTRRNKGLYHADQILNGDQATKTRQNPNGNRRGLECPEERDYYPWWNPSPWRDAAILVSDTDLYQDYFKEQSQNVKERFFCNCNDACRTSKGGTIPIDKAACETLPNAGVWTRVAPFGIDAPDVVKHDFTRDNHLGNALHTDANGNLDTSNPEPEMASYIMTIPKDCEEQMMVVRVRYNMSATHYNITYADKNANGVGADSSDDCPRISNAGNGGVDDQTSQFTPNTGCDTRLTVNSVPLYNRPYVQVFDSTQPKLSLAINTNQVGRTFQDRSYVAWVGKRPSQVGGRTIYNLNVRGRRGNIVQAYPAVEYDFVPSRLKVSDADFVHIQIHGSDYNAAKNANNGEGWQFSDRSNIVQTNERGTLFPLLWGSDENTPAAKNPDGPMFKSRKVALMWALLGQDPSGCQPFTDGQTNEQNSLTNCGKLNSAPARFPLNAADGLVQLNSGSFTYMSTRNNNFSNRSQKANIDVSATASNVGLIVGVTFGVIAGLCLIGGGTLYYGKKHPNTRAGAAYKRVSSMFTRNKGAAAAPNMEYQRS